MKPLTGQEIRMKWIHFFESKGHKWLPGVSLIPSAEDKSLLWVNAGVTGLKKYFDGTEVPPSRRIVNVQKSLRTNDIENVGHTARHHTFFEMLGNFSIGDYFRNEVIPWAYELLTNEETGFGIPVSKLYMTYEPHDKATYDLWIKCGIPDDHLVPLKENFWEIGKGPGGPDTEMFYDRGEKYDPDHLGVKLLEDDIENDRFIEIWNIVFSQYNCDPSIPREQYKELPSKNIDTGSGLERIACILQGTETNFETDLFAPIMDKIEKLSGKKYEGENLMSFRVIADHARCLTFALSDGATFSNEGRGYVLRRIIRRAMRYGQKLGIEGEFMYKLIDVVALKYQDFYPYLSDKVDEIKKIVKSEESKFLKTLESGETLLMKMLKDKKELSGEEIFKLYDTYGFPSDLTKEIAGEYHVSCDMEGFLKAMDAQRERARLARGEIDSFHNQSKDLMDFVHPSEFLYETDQSEAKVIGLFKNGEKVDSLDEEGDVIFSCTPFYAEMGGQVSDIGVVENKDAEAFVKCVNKAPNGQHLHHVLLKYGSIAIGDIFTLRIDKERRRLIERNHSATHLLHSALSSVLNKHVDQKGSYVDENYLRFDYSANAKLSQEELDKIQNEVNDKIADAIPEITQILPLEEAKKLGAEMEFSDKYGSMVRVVTFGDYSKEFCGGTHVKNSSEIGLFTIESDEAVASGVRRIQARTSLGALRYLHQKIKLLSEGERLLSSDDVSFLTKLNKENEEKRRLEKENCSLKAKLAQMEANSLSEAPLINGIRFLAIVKEGAKKADLLALADTIKSKNRDYLLILLGGEENARPIVAMVGGAASKKVNANSIVKEMSKVLGGGGGGRDEMATGQVKTKSGFETLAKHFSELLN